MAAAQVPSSTFVHRGACEGLGVATGLDSVSLESFDAGSCLLPAITTRPVLPLEEFRFVAELPHARAAVRLCWSRGLPLAAAAAMPAPEGSCERLGTTLRLMELSELAGGGLEVLAVGQKPFKVRGASVFAYRPQPAENVIQEGSKADMCNVLSVEMLTDDEHVVALSADAETAGINTMGERRASRSGSKVGDSRALRERVLELLRRIQTVEGGGGGELVEPPVSHEEDDDSDFSWWAATRLPLPPTARGILLRVPHAQQRLSICATVLAAALEEPSAQGVGGVMSGPAVPRSRL